MGRLSNDKTASRGLTCHSLSVWRNGVCVVRDLGFALDRGQALMIAGPNGSGKTSILRAVAGFLDFDGKIEFDATPLEASQIHYVGHQSGLKQHLSVAENLQFMAAILGRATPARIGEAMAIWGVTQLAASPVGELSAGQLRRTAMARLAVISRPIWLLDEPFTAVDQAGRDILTEQVASHCAAGGLVVASSHEPLPFADQRLDLGAQ